MSICREWAHWGFVTHICVIELFNITGSDNSLVPNRQQATTWASGDLLAIGLLGTNFNEIWIKRYKFSFTKTYLKMLSVNKWPSCPQLSMCWYLLNSTSPAEHYPGDLDHPINIQSLSIDDYKVSNDYIIQYHDPWKRRSLVKFAYPCPAPPHPTPTLHKHKIYSHGESDSISSCKTPWPLFQNLQTELTQIS